MVGNASACKGRYFIIATVALILLNVQIGRAADDSQAKDGYTIEQIEQAWLRREQSIKFAKLEWHQVTTHSPATLERMAGLGAQLEVTDKPVDQRATTPKNRLLVGGGKKARYDGFSLDSGLPGSGTQQSITAFDGATNKDYMSPKEWDGMGYIDGGDMFADASLDCLKMPLVVLRPYECQVCMVRSTDFQLTRTKGVVDGHKLIIIREKKGKRGPGKWMEVWLDPARDFVPMRIVDHTKQRARYQWECRYDKEKVHGVWIPCRWSTLLLGSDGTLYRGIEAYVDSVSINEPIADEEFDFVFPPGIRVHDRRTDEMYFVTATGAKRPLASWGEELAEGTSATLRGWAIGATVVIIVTLTVFIVRRRMHAGLAR